MTNLAWLLDSKFPLLGGIVLNHTGWRVVVHIAVGVYTIVGGILLGLVSAVLVDEFADDMVYAVLAFVGVSATTIGIGAIVILAGQILAALNQIKSTEPTSAGQGGQNPPPPQGGQSPPSATQAPQAQPSRYVEERIRRTRGGTSL